MPIQIPSLLIPKSGQRFALLEDKHFKGGFRVVSDVVSRNFLYTDSQSATTLKVGMLVLTLDSNITWKYIGNGDWVEYKPHPLYTHIQGEVSSLWVVTHNKNCTKFVFNIFDNDGNWILPNSCKCIDANNIEVGFSASISGSATFSFNLTEN